MLWWLPVIALALARRLLGRLRFAAALGLGRALAAVGMVGAARAVFAAEHARAGRKLRALRARRPGW